MGKIHFDKYYTPPIVAKWCIEKVYEIIGKENITEIVEPSAGSGTFSHQIPNCVAMDLYPQHESIYKTDFITESLGYKPGRLFIGNPPFGGSSGKLLHAFYDKCVSEGDYIAWILPASYYNNYAQFNKFEIIYSVILDTDYTNQPIKTAFVIYKRNKDIDRFYNPDYQSDIVEIKSYMRTNKNFRYNPVIDYDYSVCTWGILFKEAKPYEKAAVMTFKIKDDYWRPLVIKYIKWLYEYNKKTKILQQFSIASGVISIQTVYSLIHIAFPELVKEIKYNYTNEN